jgi:hypothetical protein
MFEGIHAEVLVGTPGDFFNLRCRLFREGLLEMVEGDGFADWYAIVDEISNETAQS